MNPNTPPTADLTKTITAYLVAGGTPHVAAGAAGVPRSTFRHWLKRGHGPDADPACRHFRAAVRQAHAQSRLDAEVAVRKSKPLDWLRYGPGKGSARRPDWTAARKAPARTAGRRDNPLLHPSTRAVLHLLLEALTPFPEARAAASAAVGTDWHSPSFIDT